MQLLLLGGYFILGLALLAIAMKASPRLQQVWERLRPRRTLSMSAWSNDVEETLAHMTSLDMQSGELEVHWAWLMENAPEHYDDKLILAWERLHRVQPALLLHAQKLGRYKPEYSEKALAACLDASPRNAADRCPYSKGQVAVPQIIPPPPALPSIPPPVSASVTIPSMMAAEFTKAWEEPVEAPVATTRRPFMVHNGGRARPVLLKSGT